MGKVATGVVSSTIEAALQNVQFIMGPDGDWTAVVVPVDAWTRLLARLEDQDDVQIVRERWANRATRLTWPTWEQLEAELSTLDFSGKDER